MNERMDAETGKAEEPSSLRLVRGKEIEIHGVCDVRSYDENAMTLLLTDGELYLEGSGLHVRKMLLESEEIFVSGTVDAIVYRQDKKKPGGLLEKLRK